MPSVLCLSCSFLVLLLTPQGALRLVRTAFSEGCFLVQQQPRDDLKAARSKSAEACLGANPVPCVLLQESFGGGCFLRGCNLVPRSFA